MTQTKTDTDVKKEKLPVIKIAPPEKYDDKYWFKAPEVCPEFRQFWGVDFTAIYARGNPRRLVKQRFFNRYPAKDYPQQDQAIDDLRKWAKEEDIKIITIHKIFKPMSGAKIAVVRELNRQVKEMKNGTREHFDIGTGTQAGV